MSRLQFWCGIVARMTALFLALAPARAAEEPDLIFKRSTLLRHCEVARDAPPPLGRRGRRWRACRSG
jgi:hypothetical protein